jgi:hypothetical protein
VSPLASSSDSSSIVALPLWPPLVPSDWLRWMWARSWYSQGSPLSRQRLHCGDVLSHFRLDRVHWTQALRLRMRLRTGGGFEGSMSSGWSLSDVRLRVLGARNKLRKQLKELRVRAVGLRVSLCQRLMMGCGIIAELWRVLAVFWTHQRVLGDLLVSGFWRVADADITRPGSGQGGSALSRIPAKTPEIFATPMSWAEVCSV